MLLSICSKKSSYVNSAQLGSSSEISTQEASALASAGDTVDFITDLGYQIIFLTCEEFGNFADVLLTKNLIEICIFSWSSVFQSEFSWFTGENGCAGSDARIGWLSISSTMNSASKGSFLSNKMKQKNPWKKLRQNSKIISNPVVTCVLRISFRTSSPNKSKSWISSKLPALEFPSESQEGLSKIADQNCWFWKKPIES